MVGVGWVDRERGQEVQGSTGQKQLAAEDAAANLVASPKTFQTQGQLKSNQ